MTGILNILAGSISSAIKDGYFNLVSLLLPGNGTNGAQNNTFLDSSTNNFTITRNGNTTQGTFSPFSQTGWSTYINANGNYFTSGTNSALGFGTGDFTIEFFVYIVGFTDNQFLVDFRPSGSSGATKPWIYLNTSGTLIYGTSGATQISGGTVTGNAWHHIAVSRASGSTKMFLNGAQVGSTYTDSNNYGTSERFVVGTFGDAPGSSNANGGTVIGYMSNLRILKGTGLYTGSYTVPTAALTAITNTSVLTFQSNRWVDNSTNAIAITPSGTPSVQAFSPFAPTAAYSAATNGGSGYFDGTGDVLSHAGGSFTFNDFSVSAWVYRTANASTQEFITFGSEASGRIQFFWNGNNLQYNKYGSSTVTFDSTGAMPVNQWAFVVIYRSGSTLYYYVNGTLAASGTLSGTLGNTGQSTVIGGTGFTGYIANLRVETAAYSTPSTVPTSLLSSTANSKYLLNFTNAGITDATGKNVLETVGNAQISTTQSKFGATSISLPSSTSYCKAASNPNWAFGTGDFTVECWSYKTTSTSYGSIIAVGNGAGGLGIAISSDSNIIVTRPGTAIDFTFSAGLTLNAWYHIAISRSGTSLRCFVNGTQVGTTQTSSTNYATSYLNIGIDGDNTSQQYIGYIDDLRITKYARYTSNFTPPTQAFALQ